MGYSLPCACACWVVLLHAFCTTTTASAEDNLSYRRRRKIWLHRRYPFVIWLLGASYHCSRAQILVRRSFVANLKSQVGRFEFKLRFWDLVGVTSGVRRSDVCTFEICCVACQVVTIVPPVFCDTLHLHVWMVHVMSLFVLSDSSKQISEGKVCNRTCTFAFPTRHPWR